MAFADAFGAAPTSEVLLGDWQLVSKGITYDITFQEKGVFKGRVSQNEQILWICSGKWSIDGNRLHYIYTESNLKTIPPGSVDEDELLRVAPDFYETKDRRGEIHRYNRRTDTKPNHTTEPGSPSRAGSS